MPVARMLYSGILLHKLLSGNPVRRMVVGTYYTDLLIRVSRWSKEMDLSR